MHDPLSVADLVHDELQRQASGYDVSEIEADLGLGTIYDHAHLEARYQELIKTQLRPDWHYEEPSLLEEIIAATPAGNWEGGAVMMAEQSAASGRNRAVFGYDNSRISDLARRTISLAGHGPRGDSGGHASSVA